MTKKDFQLIASVFKELGYSTDNIREGRIVFAQDIADALATTNPRFDRERFLKACESE
jgi:hypothetical protein